MMLPTNRYSLPSIIGLALFFLALAGSVRAGDRPVAKKPNIVFILADDLGFNQIGAYGDTPIKTPNLDRLAKNGIRFTQAYAGNTVCSPSRVSLLTGRDGRLMHDNSNKVHSFVADGRPTTATPTNTVLGIWQTGRRPQLRYRWRSLSSRTARSMERGANVRQDGSQRRRQDHGGRNGGFPAKVSGSLDLTHCWNRSILMTRIWFNLRWFTHYVPPIKYPSQRRVGENDRLQFGLFRVSGWASRTLLVGMQMHFGPQHRRDFYWPAVEPRWPTPVVDSTSWNEVDVSSSLKILTISASELVMTAIESPE